MRGPGPRRRATSSKCVLLGLACVLILTATSGCPPRRTKQLYMRSVEVYDPVSDQWSRGPDMPRALAWIVAAEAGGDIYVAGGRARKSARANTFMRLDPASGVWEALPNLSLGRANAGMVAVGTLLFLIGGDSCVGDLDLVEVFDTAAGTWSPGPSLPTPRRAFAATELGGEIYVLGGRDLTGPLDEVLALDPSLGFWRTLAPLPAPRFGLSANSDGSAVYAIGGWVQGVTTLDVDIYDPVTDSWAPGPALPYEVINVRSASIGTEFFLAVTTNGDPKRLLSLDTATGLWTERARRTIKSHAVGVAAQGGFVYVLGGTWTVRR